MYRLQICPRHNFEETASAAAAEQAQTNWTDFELEGSLSKILFVSKKILPSRSKMMWKFVILRRIK